MTALVWLAVPLVITFVAIGVVMWVARPKGPVDARESLAERERFTEAMQRPVQTTPQSRHGRPKRSRDSR